MGLDRASVAKKQQWMTDHMRTAIDTYLLGQHQKTRRQSLIAIAWRCKHYTKNMVRGALLMFATTPVMH